MEVIDLGKLASVVVFNRIYIVKEKNRVMELHGKLDCLYLEKAQGAFIRSRAKWIEEGENYSLYLVTKTRQHVMVNMKQYLITLIPKSDKDARYVDNLRTIILLNTDSTISSGGNHYTNLKGS